MVFKKHVRERSAERSDAIPLQLSPQYHNRYGRDWAWLKSGQGLATGGAIAQTDGEDRAIYAGSIRPSSFTDVALAAPLYFGELIVAHPFVHRGIMKKEMSPTDNPKAFRQEFLKAILFFRKFMPLVDLGLVNLVRDPCDFDFHLREQMTSMARACAPRFDRKGCSPPAKNNGRG